MDDQTLMEIQQQISGIGTSLARMEEKLTLYIQKTERNCSDIEGVNKRLNAELVPRTTITRMGNELAEMGKLVKPAQKITKWALGIVLGVFGAAGTVYVVRLLSDMTHTLAAVLDSMGGKP
jgi:hypothetical protein